jgi:hypothetical protein
MEKNKPYEIELPKLCLLNDAENNPWKLKVVIIQTNLKE